MDIEQERRSQLIVALSPDFVCFEEVSLSHAIFSRLTVRADVIAVPRDPKLVDIALAFEVKEPQHPWEYKRWARAIHQASDYVYARIQGKGSSQQYDGWHIAAAFVFPSPKFTSEAHLAVQSPLIRAGDEVMVSGAFQLALHNRVGNAVYLTHSKGSQLALRFGNNTIWAEKRGFKQQGYNALLGKRYLGSRKIDYLHELTSRV